MFHFTDQKDIFGSQGQIRYYDFIILDFIDNLNILLLLQIDYGGGKAFIFSSRKKIETVICKFLTLRTDINTWRALQQMNNLQTHKLLYHLHAAIHFLTPPPQDLTDKKNNICMSMTENKTRVKVLLLTTHKVRTKYKDQNSRNRSCMILSIYFQSIVWMLTFHFGDVLKTLKRFKFTEAKEKSSDVFSLLRSEKRFVFR